MNAREIIDIYISFFVSRGHKQIGNSLLVPQNDPTTLFTSSGMQPLVPYLLGEKHPQGKRLVNVQNSFRAQDIDEVGDNRHTTFFRMLGNWSLGDYFKAEEIPWLWEFLTNELHLPKRKLYVTVFKGDKNVSFDSESAEKWKDIFREEDLEPKIFSGDVAKNWWSRSGVPDNMPVGEPGGPDTEVYFKLDNVEHSNECRGDSPVLCECGKFLEIANSVFMQYVKTDDKTFKELPQKNVDFGGGLERLLAAVENKSDIFATNLFSPIIKAIEDESGKSYKQYQKEMRIIADHLIASIFIANENVKPTNKEQGYILRRLLRRAFDNFYLLDGENISFVIEKIVEQYKDTDPFLQKNFEEIKLTILDEEENYERTVEKATKTIKITITHTEGGTETENAKKLSADETFKLYATHGLSPTQIKSLGYVFDEQKFAELIKKHQETSRKGAAQKFKGGLADTSKHTVMGHTATHLLHQALRDVLGDKVYQTGSNITSERIRFDFNFDRNLTDEEIEKAEKIVNEKIKDNLPVHFEIMPLEKAKKLGAIGLFDDKYQKDVKIYFIGNYSKEFCGGPHVKFTGKLKRFKIKKAENIGKGQRRIYAFVADQI